jgi:hypothetical protein
LQRDWARQDTVAAIIEIVLTTRLLKEQERPWQLWLARTGSAG